MVVLLSAEFGDERSSTNVLSSLVSIFKKEGKINVPVDSSLIPIIVKNEDSVTLTDQEVTDAKDKAVSACGGANDRICIERKTQEFQKNRMDEKKHEIENNPGNIIKGRRLRVTYKDENDKVQTAEVPEGQSFKLGKEAIAEESKPISLDIPKISVGEMALAGLMNAGIFVATLAYAVTIFITWSSFNSEGYTWQTYLATATTILIPYSGIAIIIGFFGIKKLLLQNNKVV
jgi:hypothetical protein